MNLSVSRALAAALLLAAPVAAHAADSVKHVTVNYADLNLSQKSGAETLIARIETASKDACGGTPDLRDLKMRDFFASCMKATVAHAVASVNSPMVAAVYNGTEVPVEVSQR